jgi:hypothetical protein
MKKLILAAVATTCAVGVFAQGTIVFNTRISPGGPIVHVYSGGAGQIQGNGATDTPAGSTVFGGGYTLIGTSGGLTASSTFAQLLGASGFNQPESSLVPAAGITTFRTGAGAGFVAPTTATFANMAAGAPQATIEMVAWDNSSGLYPTWAEASVAWANNLIAAGRSGTWNQDSMGGLGTAPNMQNTTDPSQAVHSFNIFIPIPEPTTAALLGLGAAGLLIFRRRK